MHEQDDKAAPLGVGVKASALAMISGTLAYRDGDKVYTHIANSRVAAALAAKYDTVYLCAPTIEGSPRSHLDEPIDAGNVVLLPQPPYESSLGSLKYPLSILRAYVGACKKSDALFVRGMIPYVAVLYLMAAIHRVPICHWIIGNNLKLLLTHRRSNPIVHLLSILYALQDRISTRVGRWIARGAIICSGHELGASFRSPRTVATASSTLCDDDFFQRSDTCHSKPVRLLYVGWVRPEKGLDSLLRALALPAIRDRSKLEIVGPWEKFPEYRRKLDGEIERLGLGDRVTWTGYLAYGPALFARMRESDLLVLPSLSEGTPHVLLEAMANSLPIVATNVGGIPTCIVDGEHGLLVPPRNPEAIASAVARLIDDGQLRRSIIQKGQARARGLTVDQFAGLILSLLDGKSAAEIAGDRAAQHRLA